MAPRAREVARMWLLVLAVVATIFAAVILTGRSLPDAVGRDVEYYGTFTGFLSLMASASTRRPEAPGPTGWPVVTAWAAHLAAIVALLHLDAVNAFLTTAFTRSATLWSAMAVYAAVVLGARWRSWKRTRRDRPAAARR